MRVIFFLTVLSIVCYGEEYPEETADIFKTKLWKEIQKRLFEKESGQTETDHEAGLHELTDEINDQLNQNADAPQCARGSPNIVHSVTQNTIIKTTDSVKSGAAFLASPKIVSAAECLDKCCQLAHCTLAVYENKKKNACYLFSCGSPSRCQFTEHANYTSITLEQAPEIQPVMTTVPPVVPVAVQEDQHEDQHEDELQGLLNKPETVPPTEYQPPKTTQIEPTRPPPIPPTTILKIVPVKLFASCSQYEVCEDGNAECSLEQFCVCKDGFNPKNGRCVLPEVPVSQCGRFQFECKSPNSYPRCIASYDRCDGVSQCADGSDEADCSSAYAQDYTNNHQQPQQPVRPPTDYQSPERHQDYDARKYPETGPPEQPVHTPQDEHRQSQVGTGRESGDDLESQLPARPGPVRQPTQGDRPSGHIHVGQPQGSHSKGVLPRPRDPDDSRVETLNRKRPDLSSLDQAAGKQPPSPNEKADSAPTNVVRPQTQDRNPQQYNTRPGDDTPHQPQGLGDQSPHQRNRPFGLDSALNRKRPDLSDLSQQPGRGKVKTPNRRPVSQNLGRPDGHLSGQVPPQRVQPPQQGPNHQAIKPEGTRLQNTLHTANQPVHDPRYQQGQVYDKDGHYPYPETNPYQEASDQFKPGQQGTYNSQYVYNNGGYPHPEYEAGYHPVPDYKQKPSPQGPFNQYYNQYDTNKEPNYEKDSPYDKDAAFINNYEDSGTQPKYPNTGQGQQQQQQNHGHYPDYYESTGYSDVNSNPYPDLSGQPLYNNYHYNEANKGKDKAPIGQTGPDQKQQVNPVQPVETGPDMPIARTPRPPMAVRPTRPQPTRFMPRFRVDQPVQAKEQPMPNTGHAEVQSHPDKTESQMIHPNQGKIDDQAERKIQPQIPQREQPAKPEVQTDEKSDVESPGSQDQKPDIKVTNEKESKPESQSVTSVPKNKPSAAVDHPAGDGAQVQAHVKAPDDDDSYDSFLFYGGSQGAIVALSLSLAITVILLLFLGCRLRTVKRRLKRGRVLTSNEADYLINGMYL